MDRHHEVTLNAQQFIDAKNEQELEIKSVLRGVNFRIFPLLGSRTNKKELERYCWGSSKLNMET